MVEATRDPHLNNIDGVKPLRTAILILNWNGGQVTIDCLNSLKCITYPNYEIILIDNGSIDSSLETIRNLFPQVTTIALGANRGFVEGNNAGILAAQAAGADLVLLLNNDTVVAPDFLSKLVDVLACGADIGAVGPTIYYHETPELIWSAGGLIDWSRGTTRMLNINDTDRTFANSTPRAVDFVTGCALLVKMDVVQKVGLLDPRFFAYYEETEWCVRIGRAGYRILHVPDARIWHKISSEKREASAIVQYYMTRNRLLFLRLTHASLRAWLNTAYEYFTRLVSWSLKPRWRGKQKQKAAMIKALVDFSQQHFGPYA